MTRDHWFDALNRALVRDGPRRAVLSAAGAIAASLAAGRLSAEAAKDRKKKGKGKGKNKGKGKDKKKGNGKGKPQQCGPDIQEACASAFSLAHHTPKDVQDCTDQCAQCRAAGTAFCIIEAEERPICCPDGDVCCGGDGIFGHCCSAERCCAREGGDPPFCAPRGEDCCRDGTGGSCPKGEACCANGTCLACAAPAVPNPATCQCQCPDGAAPPCGCDESCLGPVFGCCDDECVDLTSNAAHCGRCDRECTGAASTCCSGDCVDCPAPNVLNLDTCACECPAGQKDCDGVCIDDTECPADGCGGRCAAQGLQCCGTFCYDPTQSECCAPPSFGICPRSIQHCCTTADGSLNYCQPNSSGSC